MSKPSHFLISVVISGQKHNLAYERLIHQTVPTWVIVPQNHGQAPNAERFTYPTLARDTFQNVLRGIVRQDPTYYRKGLDADSLCVEGVFIEYRVMDVNRLESEEDRKARILAQLARGEQIAKADADFLQRLLD